MLVKSKAIFLKQIKYGEGSFIIKLFTQAHGLETYFANSIKSKQSALKPSYLMPLSILDIVYDMKITSNFQRLKECRTYTFMHQIHSETLKSSIAIFAQELLFKCLPEKEANDELFEEIEIFVYYLENTQNSLANLPLTFMLKISKIIGFAYHTAYAEENFGSAAITIPEENVSSALHFLENTSYDACHELKIDKQKRDLLMQKLNRWYEMHVPGYSQINSTFILSQIFQ